MGLFFSYATLGRGLWSLIYFERMRVYWCFSPALLQLLKGLVVYLFRGNVTLIIFT